MKGILLLAAICSSLYGLANNSLDESIASDSCSLKNELKKTELYLGLGLTKTKRYGSNLFLKANYQLQNNLLLELESGLAVLGGPEFGYHNEVYFNDRTFYAYAINDVIIGDYLVSQTKLGFAYQEPIYNRLRLHVGPYYLKMMRSDLIYSSEKSWGGSSSYDNRESKIATVSSANYGFPGINAWDFGLYVGLSLPIKKWELSYSRNIGLKDWGKDDWFGPRKERASFSSFSIAYKIIK